MNENEPNPLGQTVSSEQCDYCGAILHHTYYFCLTCARPYRPIPSAGAASFVLPRSEGEIIRQDVPQVWQVFWTFSLVIFCVGVACHVLFGGDDHRFYAVVTTTICEVLKA
jgi:hypothetical protein